MVREYVYWTPPVNRHLYLFEPSRVIMAAPFRNAWKILKQGPYGPPYETPRDWQNDGRPSGGLQPGEGPQRDPYPNPDMPFRGPKENPYQPFQPDIAAQIAMIEAQIQELLQKKAALEAQSGGGGEGGAPSPNPYGGGFPPPQPPRPQGDPYPFS